MDNGAGSVIDLSPLIKPAEHYMATSSAVTKDKTSFWINVCRPLNSIEGVNCSPDASACMMREGNTPLVGHIQQYNLCRFMKMFCFL